MVVAGKSCKRGNFWSLKVVSQGGELQSGRLPRELWESLLLEILKAHLDEALSSLAEGDSAQGGFR